MKSALDIAEFILQVQGPTAAMKLQKLVYYAQAWSLAERDEPLFRERIEAWMHGPVVCELWQTHVGAREVSTVGGSANALSSDDKRFVRELLLYYGQKSASRLRQLTHEEAPWKETRGDLPENAPSTSEIPHQSMRSFYRGRPWGGSEPASDMSAFSSSAVADSRRAIAEGRVIELSQLDDALPDTGS